MSISLQEYKYKGGNGYTSTFSDAKDIKFNNGIHKFYPGFNSVIGTYENEKEIWFDVFYKFDQKCPNCNHEIIESSCYNCCHNINCGKVNYVDIELGLGTRFFYKYKSGDFGVSIGNLGNTETFDELKRAGNRLEHHICKSCYYEFYTLP